MKIRQKSYTDYQQYTRFSVKIEDTYEEGKSVQKGENDSVLIWKKKENTRISGTAEIWSTDGKTF